jgi:hypothetical protein
MNLHPEEQSQVSTVQRLLSLQTIGVEVIPVAGLQDTVVQASVEGKEIGTC